MPPTVLPARRGRMIATRSGLAIMLGLPLLAMLSGPVHAQVNDDNTFVCGEDVRVLPQPIVGPKGPPDLMVTGPCQVTTDATTPAGTWKFDNINIVKNGVLEFVEKPNARIDFWTSGILIENGGKMVAGRISASPPALASVASPFGSQGGRLRIHLYGRDQSNNDPKVQGIGITCRSDEIEPGAGDCGVPAAIWGTNGSTKVVLPGGVKDYFYKYHPLYMDGKPDTYGSQGYFGYKSIGVSYGGSLELFGAKGAMPIGATEDPTYSGNSWVRLGASIEKGATSLTLDREPGADWGAAKWQVGDEIVVTATDYLPNHSEQLTITAITGKTVAFKRSGCTATVQDNCGVQWRHQGERYPLSSRLDKAQDENGNPRLKIDPKLVAEGVETRAAVALLTRSITIQSEGDTHDQTFDQATALNPKYSFGGGLVARQGFEKLQVQGVEFKQLGQGGRKGHYPVHFHMARIVPPGTWIKDSSINESMTRWVVLHSTQNVTVARNVGWLSIGHGFYLEDATEIDNRFHSNIGIYARAAVESPSNPRSVPGILVDNGVSVQNVPQALSRLSDGAHPSVFWITNNWNDFIGNAAVGAGACGACYWVPPSYNDGSAHDGTPMKWDGYAGLQKNGDFAGTTPLKTFYKNSCSTAMNAFMSVVETAPCLGVVSEADGPRDALKMVKSIAPSDKTYYPQMTNVPYATHCKALPADQQTPGMPTAYDCSNVTARCKSGDPNCGVTVLDHFTTSFNWAHHNFAAVWLRQFWYLFDNSVITDNMLSGLTFVSGGDYTRSSVVEGYWAMARNSVFVGETQPKNPFAYSTGPVGKDSGIDCDDRVLPNRDAYYGDSCVIRSAGISIQKANFGVNQRLFNIYDGPTYQAGNAFLDVTTRACNQANGCVWAKTGTHGLRNNPTTPENSSCYSPNAAVAWKQPNGFYYPPAFHSANLHFDNVDIRHYVIAPLFLPTQLYGKDEGPPPNFGQGGSYVTDYAKGRMQYCYFPPNGFQNYTDIDRQTELSDNDGSLTGLVNTISVNEDPFFNAPIETSECKSNVGVDPILACNGQPTPASVVSTVKTSPYDYVTTVVIPADCVNGAACSAPYWSQDCAGPFCYGVPIFRQFLQGSKAKGTGEWANWQKYGCDNATGGVARAACRWPFLRMAGQSSWQRSNMTVNHGSYYIDTTVSVPTQTSEPFYTTGQARSINAFMPERSYALMFVFAKESTQQTYQLYVGKQFNKDTDVKPVRANVASAPVSFSPDGNAPKWYETKFDNGILTINVNFALAKDLAPSPTNGQCKPANFCQANGNSCTCSLADDDPRVLANPGLKASCNDVCGNWSMKDVDCPLGGCYAVSIRMAADFEADDVQRRPQPTEFPGPTVMSLAPGIGDRGWESTFKRTLTLPDGKAGGTCYYEKLPGTAECLSPPAN